MDVTPILKDILINKTNTTICCCVSPNCFITFLYWIRCGSLSFRRSSFRLAFIWGWSHNSLVRTFIHFLNLYVKVEGLRDSNYYIYPTGWLYLFSSIVSSSTEYSLERGLIKLFKSFKIFDWGIHSILFFSTRII